MKSIIATGVYPFLDSSLSITFAAISSLKSESENRIVIEVLPFIDYHEKWKWKASALLVSTHFWTPVCPLRLKQFPHWKVKVKSLIAIWVFPYSPYSPFWAELSRNGWRVTWGHQSWPLSSLATSTGYYWGVGLAGQEEERRSSWVYALARVGSGEARKVVWGGGGPQGRRPMWVYHGF